MRVVSLVLFFFAFSARAEIQISSRYLEDPNRNLSIDSILTTDPSAWQKTTGAQAVFGPTKSRYWLRFQIFEQVPHPTDPVMLEISNGFIDSLELYAVLDGKVIQHSRTGLQVPFLERNWGVVQTGSPTFRVLAPRDPRTEYFLSATSHFPLAVPILALPVKEFYIHQWRQLLFLGAFFGTLLIAAVFNAFLAVSLRSRLYANYSLFVATVTWMFFSQEGLSVQLFWRDWHWFSEREMPIAGALAVFFYSQFMREFLNSKVISPLLDRILVTFVAISALGALGLVFTPRLEFAMPGHLAAVGTNVCSLLIAIQALRKRVNAARYFFLSSVVFNLSLVAFVLQENNLVWFGDFISRGAHLGTVLEVLLLSFALADRIRKMNQELTQQKNAVVHSEKMSALGRLAGEISHEINNPLAIIHGNASLILKIDTNPQVREFAQTIEQTANRISKIVKGMRSLSRDSRNDPLQRTPLSSLLQDSLSLCADRAQTENIKIDIFKPENEVFILCRPSEICQVLLNLMNNAFDAVEGSPDPWIKVEARAQGRVAEISIADSGPGIPKETQPRILEPFFTTKEPGKGLGLGLSISKSIVEAHGGRLTLDEDSPHTRFIFSVPLAPAGK